MIAGSTVCVRISGLPVPIGRIASLKVIYRSVMTKEITLVRDLSEMEADGDALHYTITQQESLALSGKHERSVVLLTTDGLRCESLPELVDYLPSAYTEVLS